MHPRTCKELMDEIYDYHADENADTLCDRVQDVIVLCKAPRCVDAYDLARKVLDLLDGEK